MMPLHELKKVVSREHILKGILLLQMIFYINLLLRNKREVGPENQWLALMHPEELWPVIKVEG